MCYNNKILSNIGTEMLKRLIIILFSGFLGIIGAPEILMASDDFLPTGLSNERIAETVQVVEEPPVERSEEEISVEQSDGTLVYGADYGEQEVVEYQPVVLPANRIEVGGKVIEMIDSDNTANDAGGYAARYNNYFIYGHNSAGVFAVLYGVGVNDVFSIAYGGTTTSYRVKNTIIYRKTGETSLRVDDARSDIDGEDVPMKYIANGQEKRGGRRSDSVLMTCDGTSYGNGDASHRLVIFADVI